MGLLEKLKAGKKNIKIIKFPGTDEDIGITVLTEAETQDAVFAAERFFKESGIEVSATTIGAYQSELNTQILLRCLVDPSKKKKDGTYEGFFKDTKEFKSLLAKEAKDILVEEYNGFESECSPSPLKMTDDEFDRLFDELKKSPQTVGSSLSLKTLKGLIIYLAVRPATSPKDSGSTS